MTYRLNLAILAVFCLCGILVGPGVLAQEDGDVSRLMTEAGKCLLESRVNDARSLCAQILRREADDAARNRAALFLVMTYEADGALRDAECRAWATKQFPDAKTRTLIEKTMEEYRRKFLAGAPADDVRVTADTWRLADPDPALPLTADRTEKPVTHDYRVAEPLDLPTGTAEPPEEIASMINELTLAASKDLFSARPDLRGTRDALHSSIAVVRAEPVREETPSPAHAELVRRGEEVRLQNSPEEARQLFAKALALESKKNVLSRAAKGIVLSFQGESGLDVKACKTWSEVNVPVAEDRLRIALAVGELYYQNQEYDQAITCLENVLREADGELAETALLFVALSHLGQGKRDTALAELNRVASESSSEEIAVRATFLVGWAYLQAQEYGAAKRAFDRLVSNCPESPFAQKARELSDRMELYVE